MFFMEKYDKSIPKLCMLPLLSGSAGMDGWIICYFTSFSTAFQSHQDDEMLLCAMEPRLRLRRFRFEPGSNSRPLDQ